MRRKLIILFTAFAFIAALSVGISAYADGTNDLSSAEIEIEQTGNVYTSKELKPSVNVFITKDGVRSALKANKDYKLKYENNINVGTATVTATGAGSYTGSISGSFTILPLMITSDGFTFTEVQKAYPGVAPVISVKYNDSELAEGVDFNVNVNNGSKAGYKTATVEVIGSGNFTGTKKLKYSVYPSTVSKPILKRLSANSVKLSWDSLSGEGITGYTIYSVDKKGNILKSVKSVKTNSATISNLKKGMVFHFAIKAYKTKDDHTVTGDISPYATTYTVPDSVTLTYANKASKKSIVAQWESTECSGYQIKYSTNKKFKSNVKYAYASKNSTKKTIKVPTSSKPYYVKVRAYTKLDSGKKRFGPWSLKYCTEYAKLYESYQTYYVNNPNRTTNLKLACKAIDGTIVNPGEVFSFNKTVGIRTAAKGYKPAPIFTGTTGHEDGVGGGVCQVASTMFNAALYCNFQIVERHQHSQRVAYCPLGRDAAIFWGSEDFKFKNTSEFPVKIRMSCGDGKLSCKIYTNGYKKPPKVTLSVSQSGKNFTLRRTVGGKVNYTTRSNY